MKSSRRAAFTLIELIVVLAIIASHVVVNLAAVVNNVVVQINKI